MSRKSAAISGSPVCPGGSSRASTGSPPESAGSASSSCSSWSSSSPTMPASASTSRATSSSPRRRNGLIEPPRWRSSAEETWPPCSCVRSRARSRVLLVGRPQPVGVQPVRVVLHPLPRARADDRLALVVHLQHELGGGGLVEAEQVLQYEGHVGHQVDRVVPDDRHPGAIEVGLLPRRRLGRPRGRERSGHAITLGRLPRAVQSAATYRAGPCRRACSAPRCSPTATS